MYTAVNHRRLEGDRSQLIKHDGGRDRLLHLVRCGDIRRLVDELRRRIGAENSDLKKTFSMKAKMSCRGRHLHRLVDRIVLRAVCKARPHPAHLA